MKITLENICIVCEKKGCIQPCQKWYDCLEGKSVDFGFIESNKEAKDEKC